MSLDDDALDDWSALFNDSSSSDVQLRCQDVVLFAHKRLLSTMSTVFAAQFSGRFTLNTDSNCATATIDVDDVAADVMIELLRQLYCGQCTINVDNCSHLLFASKKYNYIELENRCLNFFDSCCCVRHIDNALHLWRNALLQFDEEQIILQFLLHNATAALTSTALQQLPSQKLLVLLESDHLNCDREQLVFDAVMKWSQYQLQHINSSSTCSSNIDSANDDVATATPAATITTTLFAIAQPVLNCVRFGLLPIDFFDRVVANSGLFEADDIYNIRQRLWRSQHSSSSNTTVSDATVATRSSAFDCSACTFRNEFGVFACSICGTVAANARNGSQTQQQQHRTHPESKSKGCKGLPILLGSKFAARRCPSSSGAAQIQSKRFLIIADIATQHRSTLLTHSSSDAAASSAATTTTATDIHSSAELTLRLALNRAVLRRFGVNYTEDVAHGSNQTSLWTFAASFVNITSMKFLQQFQAVLIWPQGQEVDTGDDVADREAVTASTTVLPLLFAEYVELGGRIIVVGAAGAANNRNNKNSRWQQLLPVITRVSEKISTSAVAASGFPSSSLMIVPMQHCILSQLSSDVHQLQQLIDNMQLSAHFTIAPDASAVLQLKSCAKTFEVTSATDTTTSATATSKTIVLVAEKHSVARLNSTHLPAVHSSSGQTALVAIKASSAHKLDCNNSILRLSQSQWLNCGADVPTAMATELDGIEQPAGAIVLWLNCNSSWANTERKAQLGMLILNLLLYAAAK